MIGFFQSADRKLKQNTSVHSSVTGLVIVTESNRSCGACLHSGGRNISLGFRVVRSSIKQVSHRLTLSGPALQPLSHPALASSPDPSARRLTGNLRTRIQ